MLLVKLGGSVITDKSRIYTFREEVMKRLAHEIKDSKKNIIVVHGAGSFGHIEAKKHKLDEIFIQTAEKRHAVARVQRDVRLLNQKVLNCFISAGLHPASIPPSVAVICKNKKIKYFNYDIFKYYQDCGLMPVTFGDVVGDEKLGFAICSGDLLMLALAKKFLPEKAVFVMDLDGFYDSNPVKNKNAKLLFEMNKRAFSRIRHERYENISDVTGGAVEKMRLALQIAKFTEVLVLNGNVKSRLRDALIGKEVIGTRVVI